MKQNIRKIHISVINHALSYVTLLALMVNLAAPQSVQAKGILALFSGFMNGEAVVAAEEAPEEMAAFPESDIRPARKSITVVSTAYNSLAGQTDNTPCIPASGYDLCKHWEKYGSFDTIAANFLPLGTRVRFPDLYGDKVFIVRDRMNARYGYGRVDIWLPEYASAKTFGVKRLKMEIL